MRFLDIVKTGKLQSLHLATGNHDGTALYVSKLMTRLSLCRQMGFPSTAQVERLNEEAVEMKKEKHERQKKEKAIDEQVPLALQKWVLLADLPFTATARGDVNTRSYDHHNRTSIIMQL